MAGRNVTMVAFHGSNKPSLLKQLRSDVLEQLAQAVGSSFSNIFDPFDEAQTHATLIGMEAAVIGGQFYGHWFNQNRRGTKRPIDLKLLTNLLKRLAGREPMFTIRFGGFRKAHCTCVGKSAEGWACPTGNAEFHSCDRSAYEGSFYAYAPGPVMLTGWPLRTPHTLDEFPHYLYDFRLAAEAAGFLDKYHSDNNPHWRDDDCYIKLGAFNKPLPNLGTLEEEVREYIHNRAAVTVDIAAKDVSILLYEDPSLKDQTILGRLTLSEAIADERKILKLYQRLQE